jgi:GntR family transcriptional regulator
MAQLGRQEAVLVEVSRVPTPRDIADRLGVDEGTVVIRRHRRMGADGVPLILSTSYIPLEFAAGTPIEDVDAGPGGTYARLEERGHLITSYREEITTRMPSPRERAELTVPDGVPVFRVIRCACGYEGTVFEVNDQIMPGDRYTIVYTFDAE